MAEYFRSNEGCFIRSDLFEKFKHLAKPNETGIRYTHTNEKKAYRIRMLGGPEAISSWQWKELNKIPDVIKHYKDLGNGYVKIPLGLASFYHQSYQRNYANEIINHPDITYTLFDYQEMAINEIITRTVGLMHADTGTGKTVMICAIASRLKRNTLIIVENLTQMSQMVDDIYKILGVIPTQVSGEVISKKKAATFYPYITVCSIGSRDKVDPKNYGTILIDECDKFLGSDDRREWIGSLAPEYMYGLTGTIQVNHMNQDIFSIYYGNKTRLELLHHSPDYIQVHTNFQMQMEGDTQFHEIKEALYTAENRNKLIVDTLVKNISGRKGLIFTEYVAHAIQLQQMIEARGIKAYLLIGKVEKKERERVRQEVKNYKGDCVIVGSTEIIGRGFDIAELSLAVMTTAERFAANHQQYLGRIIRSHPTKKHPIFIDMVDANCFPLYAQAKSRLSTFKKVFPTGKVSIIK